MVARKVTADSGIDALTTAIESLHAIDFDQLDAPDGAPVAYEASSVGQCLAKRRSRSLVNILFRQCTTRESSGAGTEWHWARHRRALVFQLRRRARACARISRGGAVHVSHGAGNVLLLPFVSPYNLPVRKPGCKIAALLGEDIAGLSKMLRGPGHRRRRAHASAIGIRSGPPTGRHARAASRFRRALFHHQALMGQTAQADASGPAGILEQAH